MVRIKTRLLAACLVVLCPAAASCSAEADDTESVLPSPDTTSGHVAVPVKDLSVTEPTAVRAISPDGPAEEEAEEPPTTTEAPPPVVEIELVQAESDLLDIVIDRGELKCGVSGSYVAFSETQPDGSQIGFDADYCRAVAAAIFADAGAVEFVPLTAAERFTALQTGAVDVLMRNTTWTQNRDIAIGVDFGPTTYYDGQQLMARVSDGFSTSSQVADIAGAVVCTNAGTTIEQNIAYAAEAAGINMTLHAFDDFDIVTTNFIQGACDVITTDGSSLINRRVKQQPDGEQWVIFPPRPISKEPLGPVYVQNQSRFADVVNWTVYATIIADEKGIGSDNIDARLGSGELDAETIRMFGGEGELQTAMGLSTDAFYYVISQVGNYDEIYSRHFVPVGLQRAGGLNSSWLDGGLIYAPVAR